MSSKDNEPVVVASVRKLMREHNAFGMNQLTPEMVVGHFRKMGWREPSAIPVPHVTNNFINVYVPQEPITDPDSASSLVD